VNPPNYVVITPARDECAHLRLTIESMLAQSLPPLEWVIVDDGSHDETAAVIAQYARQHPWIHAVKRKDRGHRFPGAGVAEAFWDGYRCLHRDDWEFLVKLDADLSFAPDFFQEALKYFCGQPSLGIGGASLYSVVDGVPHLETGPRFHVRGATKIYRRACWEAIGGIIIAPGWDTVDEIKAQMLQWRTETFSDVCALHHRPTGGASHWRDMIKRGQGCYMAGYHPAYVAARCVRQLGSKPYVLGSICMGVAFLAGYLGRLAGERDPSLVHYVHEQQWRKLRGGTSMWK